MIANANRRTGYWLILVAAMLWGTTGTVQAFAPPGTQPQVVGALRLLVGGIGLLAWAQWGGVLRRPTRAEMPLLLLGAVGVAAYQLLFFAGVARTGVAIGTIVGIGSSPILAGVLDWLVNRQPLTGRWVIATALAIAGAVLLTLPGEQVIADGLGVLLAVGTGGMYALYATAGKRLLVTLHPDAMSALMFGLAMLLLLPALFTADNTWVLTPNGMVLVLHLGLLATTAAYVCFSRGLQRVAASTAVTLSLAEPLTAAVLGVTLLGERLTPPALVGIGLLLLGLWWLTRQS
ncbi:MAG: EamA family transporter [Armatimonadetes bacterium]|nr:EamA family transporter [Anaerolineae bacterium]